MIPLGFFCNSFWYVQILFFLIFFMFLFNFSFDYLFVNVSYVFGCDLLSFIIIVLSFYICSLIVLAREKIYKYGFYFNIFCLLMVLLILFLYCTFSSINLFVFYLFFEASLVPTLILILGWGYQPERIQAGVYLLFYTMFASLPILIAVFYFYKKLCSLDYFFIRDLYDYLFIYFCINFVFFVKIPIFLVHLWLPKAHVEAPVSGSMILAGIILKLGGYGLIRFMICFLSLGIKINYFFVIIRMMGGVVVSLICLRQVDIKSLIAYSSVAHMGMVLAGIITLNYWGFCGSFLIMIAHGLCSSGLFCLANISYERISRRRLFLNKGLINLMPRISLWWFLFSSSNIAAPPSLNLLGEIMLLTRLIGWSSFCILMLSLISFLSAAYSLYLYSYSQHGNFYSGLFSFSSGYVREYLLLFLHWFPLNFLFLKSEYLVIWI